MNKKGYDEFNLDSGNASKVVICKVCGKPCEYKGNIHGYRSYAGAMSGRSQDFDHFLCKDVKEDWHLQALAIRILVDETPSAKLAAMMEEEIEEILETKETTKDKFNRGY